MNELGLCYEMGRGVEKDIHRAAELYRQAAQGGMAAAQCNLGVLYREGLGVGRTTARRRPCSGPAAQGFARGQFLLGLHLEDGRGIDRNEKQAAQEYRRAAGQTIPTEWQRWPGAMSTVSGWSATPIWRRISMTGRPARGHVRAAYALGNMLLSGDAIGQDPARALELYQQAAQAGHMGALRQVGRCYQKGKGCQKDEAKAFDCFRRSAEGGDGPAAVSLGYCYEKGSGCPADAQAAHWYEEAARRGLPLGQYDLGCLYEAGQGVPRDRRKALELIAGWLLVAYAMLMGAGLWEGSAGDRIIWLAAAALPAVAGGCCLHYGRRLVPPLSRIGRIALTVLGAVLAFFFVSGDRGAAGPGGDSGRRRWGSPAARRCRCGDHAAGRPAEAPYIKSQRGVYQTVHAPAAYEKERLEESFVISSINDGRRSSRTDRCTRPIIAVTVVIVAVAAPTRSVVSSVVRAVRRRSLGDL